MFCRYFSFWGEGDRESRNLIEFAIAVILSGCLPRSPLIPRVGVCRLMLVKPSCLPYLPYYQHNSEVDYNDASLLDTPKDSFIDGGIICKHMYNILHGESVFPNPYLHLILLTSIGI